MPPRRRGKATTARAAAIQAVQRKRRAQLQQHDEDEDEDDASTCHHNHHHSHSSNYNSLHLNSTNKDSNHHHHGHHHSHNHSHSKSRGNNRCTGSKHGKKRSHREEEEDDEFSSEEEEEDDDEDDDDCPPPLVGNDEEFCDDGDGGDVDEEEEEEDEDDEEDDDDDDDAVVGSTGGHSSNTMSGEGGCLHCHKSASPSDIQVRCDECQAYICQNCHWCHEFQANHEIRVCDRCDAFYCRTCDEMDQCDDCGEVVCASCSTLLSCKFCGGGLCEECATACGRCGIVLCSRDAKFAVDCDTCRLSYCLVCLASGSKDPCVRCGHRPSKRMEQLVHLRLKSIYKAFKQSSRNSKYSGAGGEGGGGEDDEEDDDDDVDEDEDDDDTEGGKSGDPQSLLQAAASAASKHSGARSNSSRHSSHHHHHTSSSHHSANNSKRATSSGASTVSRDQQAKEMVDKYMAEKEKADAAAAALLAELDEEEEAMKSKKNKKKRKKERQQAKKEEIHKKNQPPSELPKIMSPSRQKQQRLLQEQRRQQQLLEQLDDNDDDSDVEIIDVAKLSSVKEGTENQNGTKKKKKDKKADGDASVNNKTRDSAEAMSAKVNYKSDATLDFVAPTEVDRPEEPVVDPIEQQLCRCVADEDLEGIEDILLTLKGVPGRAQLRKNAKKALKKLKTEQEAASAEEAKRLALLKDEEEAKKAAAEKAFKEYQQLRSAGGAGTPATHSETNSTGVSNRPPPPPPLPQNELYRVVSIAHGKPVSATTTNPAQRASKTSSTPAVRSESVVHIAYNVVGWVIGKGGQRIRDLMEDSGARVWIDQEHLTEKDPRIVYISGGRKQVEAGVKLLKELVGKAPVPGGGPGEAGLAVGAPPAPVLQLAEKANILLSRAESRGHKPEIQVKKESLDSVLPSEAETGRVISTSGGVSPLQALQLKTGDPRVLGSEKQVLIGTTKISRDGEVHEHEMTCEACFVPLLIGRRGWTIKHIQDSSGARVDIDQTVTPRKVKISGSGENVQSAIRMVRDVLSYPHAQLQGAAESLDDMENPPESLDGVGVPHLSLTGLDISAAAPRHLESTAATFSNTTTVGASNQVVEAPPQSSPVFSSRTAEERVHTPPPSSHINIGDAKSTISASSSLSSTPEPSMASTSKGHYGTAPPQGHQLQHDYGGSYPQQQQQPQSPAPPAPPSEQPQHPSMPGSNLFGQQSSMQQMNLNNMADNRVASSAGGVLLAQQPHVTPPLFPGRMSGVGMPAVSPRHDMQSSLPRDFHHPHHRQLPRHHPNQQSMLLGQAALREQQQHHAHLRSMNGLGGMPSHYLPRPDSHAMCHHGSLQFPGGMPNQQQPSLHLHQQSAFHPSDQKQLRHHSAPEIGMGSNRIHPTSDMGAGNVVDPRGKPGGFVRPGMWSDQGTSLVLGADGTSGRRPSGPKPEQQQRVNTMQSRQAPDPRLNSGASMGLGLGLPAPGGALRQNDIPGLNTPGRDDSRMVDSLFGPSEGSQEEKNLLTGFQGLSFGDDGLGGDMWSKNIPQNWEGETKGSSALLTAIQPNLAPDEVQHPPKSRFIWGASGGSQGQPS